MVSELTECASCGAVLQPQDEFCGECGAPRPSTVKIPGPPAGLQPGGSLAAGQAPVPPPVRIDSARRFERESAWRAGFYILLVLGVLACLAGLILFLAFGLSESDVATPEENWLYSTICCLLPIGGTGAMLLLAGIAIRHARLREPGTRS